MEDRELNYTDLIQRDIDIVNTCRLIRRLAMLEKIKIDTSESMNDLNKHLFDYIACCRRENGKSDEENVREFVIECLSNLQPFMIEGFVQYELYDEYICVLDNVYRISVYLNVNTRKQKEIAVSFQEKNRKSTLQIINLFKNMGAEFVPVIADSILSKKQDIYKVKVFIQRGLMILPIELCALKCEDIWLVRRSAIEKQLSEWYKVYINDLFTSDLELDVSGISFDSVIKPKSNVTDEKDVFLTISILVDSWKLQDNYISKRAADFAIITYVCTLEISSEKVKKIENLLKGKYGVTRVESIACLIQRIGDVLNSK